LLRLSSPDLRHWQVHEPVVVPGGEPGYPSIPECPDYFYWNGWYYLLFGLNWMAHYRMSRSPYGPWIRPKVDTFDGMLMAVMKTAPYHHNRRIGVAFLGSRKDNLDQGDRDYAGNAVFRELVQLEDGTLACKFPPEMLPPAGAPLQLPLSPLTHHAAVGKDCVRIDAREGFGAGMVENVPVNARIKLHLHPEKDSADFGLCLRGFGNLERGYFLRFLPFEQRVVFNQQYLSCVEGLDQPFQVEIIQTGDIIDICINQQRCLIDRCPELRGERLFFFCQNGSVTFDNISIQR
jgi:beta-fructofuranosidase